MYLKNMHHDDFLKNFAFPAARCSPHGELLDCNDDFEKLCGDNFKIEVFVAQGRAFLQNGTDHTPLRLLPLNDGSYLLSADACETQNLKLLSRQLSQGLSDLEETLLSSVSLSLLERPKHSISTHLRELLAATQLIKKMQQEVGRLDSPSKPARRAVHLQNLLQELAACGVPVHVSSHVDCMVKVDQEQLLYALGALFRVLGKGLDPDQKICVSSTLDAQLRVRISTEHGLFICPELEQLRNVMVSEGGRMLLVSGILILEMPVWQEPARPTLRETILVVDDDDVVLEMMEEALKQAGFSVLMAENGVQASVLLRQHPEIAAVVADAVLPGRSGVELAREAQRQEVPVLLISGHSKDLLGVKDMPILKKPFGLKTLTEQVERMVKEG